ncbi:MAG: chorismate synthase, partial [Candidatus Anammoxibacter sp.]
IPSGVCVPKDAIEYDLIRRQVGYCRGWRQAVEKNELDITSGIYDSITTGAPISIIVYNTEGVNNPVWRKALGAYPDELECGGISIKAAVREKQRSVFIPGHADLAGIIKYRHKDNNLRFVSDRASARETIVRVAIGTIARRFLSEFGISVYSYVTQIGNVKSVQTDDATLASAIHREITEIDAQIAGNFKKTCGAINKKKLTIFNVPPKTLAKNRTEIIDILNNNLIKLSDCAKVKSPDKQAAKKMVAEIDDARKEGDTVGGVIKIIATNVPPGLGSYVHGDKRLSSKLAAAILSMPAVKGVEFGIGFEAAGMRGSEMHDSIRLKGGKFFTRDTNNAGGLEGGMTNSEPLVINAAIKPISMISKKAIKTVDIKTGKETIKTSGERADVCAVPSATVIGESLVAIELVNAMIEKFGGDNITETMENYKSYMSYVTKFYKKIKTGK